MEFREVKPHYTNRLLDKRVMIWRDAHEQDAAIPDEEYACADPIRQVHMIHFYDYNGSWSLDVAIKETGVVTITDAGIRMLQERFGCHEYDEDPARLAAMGILEHERPALFYFAIDHVVESTL